MLLDICVPRIVYFSCRKDENMRKGENNMVGNNIKRFRTKCGMTQDELAEKLSVTRQAVSNWERGKTEPDIETLDRLAQALDVSTEELIYGEEAKKKSKQIYLKISQNGIEFGSALAMIISYVTWRSIGWAILHGMLGWAYVIYYAIKY